MLPFLVYILKLKHFCLFIKFTLSSGSTELAAVGVSISVFNLVSKLFNVPLLNVTTSFVAEQQAMDDDYGETGQSKLMKTLKIDEMVYILCVTLIGV
jgi:hypothetical protein